MASNAVPSQFAFAPTSPRIIQTAGLLLAIASFTSGFANAAESAAPADRANTPRTDAVAVPPSPTGRATRAYRNGPIFTADATHRSADAIAIRDGKIVFVGSDSELARWIGPSTELVDLHGKFLMPGLIDGHMHPLQAGTQLLKCGLDYASLTVAELQSRVANCLAASADKEPDGWLEVVNWFQESMRPAGVTTSRSTLDTLDTKRPIIVRSSFGHTVLANSRALELAHIDATTPDPVGGKIWRDAAGSPTGLLEDSAFAVFDALLPQPAAADNVAAARAALEAMRRQGITTFLDAVAPEEDLAAFTAVHASGALTARAHFAPRIEPKQGNDPAGAVAAVVELSQRFDKGAPIVAPGIAVRNAKLFLDGVIAAPALTGAVLEPYRSNAGSSERPNWVAGTSRGPAVYFSPQTLAALLVQLGKAGIDPHLHADGDAAVRAALDAVAVLRKALPGEDVRPAIAHDEIVDPADYPRFRELGAVPVLSFQWGKPAGDTLGLTDYFGPVRMARLEPAGVLAAAGARIAFGSDWPVDPLDEWFALKVGVTRTNTPDAPSLYRGRLGDDPGLSREAVLDAATINAAYELHVDAVIGSLAVGKFADVIVLDRNPLTIPAEDIANVRVLETVVGGRVVHHAEP
jgi:predicted amidohydrolase YtcJ